MKNSLINFAFKAKNENRPALLIQWQVIIIKKIIRNFKIHF